MRGRVRRDVAEVLEEFPVSVSSQLRDIVKDAVGANREVFRALVQPVRVEADIEACAAFEATAAV